MNDVPTPKFTAERYAQLVADFTAVRAALERLVHIIKYSDAAAARYVEDVLSRFGTREALQVVREAQKILQGDVSAAEYQGEEDTAAKDVLFRLKALFGESEGK